MNGLQGDMVTPWRLSYRHLLVITPHDLLQKVYGLVVRLFWTIRRITCNSNEDVDLVNQKIRL